MLLIAEFQSILNLCALYQFGCELAGLIAATVIDPIHATTYDFGTFASHVSLRFYARPQALT